MNYAVNIVATILLFPWPAIVIMSPMMIAARGFSNDKSSIIITILFFIYPALIFLLIKLFGFKFYGTEPLAWGVGFSIAAVIIIQLYGLPRMLSNLYSNIPNEGYHITTDKVYKNGIPLKEADPQTFTSLEGTHFYSKDAYRVYADFTIIKNADAPSFGAVEGSNGIYWKDKNSAYSQWERIKDSDGETFEWIGHNYAKDKNHVYFDQYIVDNADPNSFKALESYIGRDNHAVFVRHYEANNIRDLDSFELIHFDEKFFGKDNHHVYAIFYNSSNPLEIFPGADPATFKPVGEYYAVDDKHVYHYSYHRGHVKVLSGVNPDNFVLEHDPATGANARAGDLLFRNGDVVSPEDEP
ncbi:DKNYY domain-containing protein [Marivirga tractuosa]|uniref:DKNYY domain-containing protein n=1 Tax=Marivirga tractuosa TaxID=1006 RepID=UPI0035D02A20